MESPCSHSDWDVYSDSGSSEDLEEIELLYGGKAQNILSSLEESIGKIDDYLSFERVFEYGDLVCSAADPSGQMGRIINVDMLVDLENLHGKVIKDVNSKNLFRICSISVGDYVISGPWLGRVTKVVDCVSILFDDGARCEVTAVNPDSLIPVSSNILEDSQYPYYPGQRVVIKASTTSKPSIWFFGTWKENRCKGTVCSVKPGLVYVNWLASAAVSQDPRLPVPPTLQNPEDITLLSCFSHATWQVGDWAILPMIQSVQNRRNVEKKCQVGLNTDFQEVFVIAKTKTKFDVLWQDGSQSFCLGSSSLLSKDAINTHEFFPGQFVLEKGACDYEEISSNKKRWGVVDHVDAKEQMVKVKWKSFSQDGDADVGLNWTEETMSAYGLVEHPDYSYSIGDAVFSSPCNHFLVHPCEDVDGGIRVGQDKKVGNKNCSKELEKCFTSYIGIVTGFGDGVVEVKWATGLTSKVAPFEIYLLQKCEGLAETSIVSGELFEHLDQEATDYQGDYSNQEWKDLSNMYCNGEHSKKSPCESSISLTRFAIDLFTGIVGNLFGSFGSTLLPGSVSTSQMYEENEKSETFHEEELCNCCTESQKLIVDESERVESTSLEQEVKNIHEVVNVQYSSVNMSLDRFRLFGVINDCSDHHFSDVAGMESALTQVDRSWLKKVQQEWIILEKNLPETIYVRIYEERMDLMRAAVIGAPGTPYHDGLFLFDLYLPPDYPHQPPLVHYHSGGLRLNPNLYENGKVCLSLLNTWTGTGSEVWNPGNSTILQVLLSLQALVLNDKPYFNEAGYDSQIGKAEGEKNSISYNENAFLVNCKSMLRLLHKPPKNFEALVEEHFECRAQQILLACKTYMDGAPVGYTFGNNVNLNEQGSSTGFKIMLAKIFPKLVEAFAAKGIDCS